MFERYSRPQLLGGQPVGRVWSFRDVTVRVRAEAERDRLEAQVRQAQKLEAVGTLAGGIAHDFNNILTAIMNYTALAVMDSPPENIMVHDYLTQIGKASHRARELVRQILMFSRREEKVRVPVRLETVMADVASLVRSTLPATIAIVAKPGAKLPLVVADPTQLHQVLLNLCVNAGQAIGDEPGSLTLAAREVRLEETREARHAQLPPGTYVQIDVADTGCGMDAATVERMFEPFFTTKRSSGGTGLGLAVVHGIVRSHGGSIEVRSAVGRGTTFEVLLPAQVETGLTSPESPVAPKPVGRGEQLLVVDDEDAAGRSLAALLERIGYRVTYLADPNHALALFKAVPERFKLAILDLQMPGMNGITLAERMLAVRPRLPIIIASGDAGRIADQARALGVRDVLAKPVALEILAGKIPALIAAS